MKDKKILLLILIIIIDPILIIATLINKTLSESTRNSLGIIEIALYVFAIVYSLWLIHKKKQNNK